MANIKSQIKRNKQATAAQARNKTVESALKTDIKKFGTAAEISMEEAGKTLKAAVVALDKAASGKVIHKNEAARRKSALMKKYNEVVKNPPAPPTAEEKPAKSKKTAKTATTSKTKKTSRKPAAKKATAKKIAKKSPAKKTNKK